MPIGTTVTAARGGQVVFIEQRYSDKDIGTEKANVIVIRHTDGTYGRYVHLTQNGALVETGQNVAQGEEIGLSGGSGYPSIPHLHFDVTKDCPEPDCQTQPVCFKNMEPDLADFVAGKTYLAEPYEK